MRSASVILLLTGLALVVGSAPAFAQGNNPFANDLTGDWGGARTALHDKGIDLNLDYIGDFAHNFTGGDKRTTGYGAAFDFTGAVDFAKLFGWRGGSFHIELVNMNGTLLDTKAHLGSLLDTEQIFAAGHVTWLTNFYLEQSLWNGLVDLKYGRMDLATNFDPFPCSNFQSLAFCGPQPGWAVADLTGWPTSSIGEVVTIQPAKSWDFKIGNFAVQPNNLVPSEGIKPQNRGHRIGNMTIAEVDFHTSIAGSAHGAPLPGTWVLGGWHNSAPQPDLFLDVNGLPQVLTGAAPLIRNSAGGVYFSGQQQVTVNAAGGGLSILASVVQADSRVVFLDQMLMVGAVYTAPFPSRPNDSIGFAVGRDRVSGKVADGQRLLDAIGLRQGPTQGSEYLAEASYTVQLPRGISVMPNVQYVHHPGGTSANHDFFVLGTQLIVPF